MNVMDDPANGFRPIFSNYVRELAPELARIAVFTITIGRGPVEDRREAHEQSVSGCESSRCVIRADSGEIPKDAPT